MPAPHTLSEKERKVVVGFLNGLTRREAVLAAGYNPGSKTGPIFDKPQIQDEIRRRQHQMSTKAGVDADWIVSRLKSLADANPVDLYSLDEEGLPRIDLKKLTPDLRRALTGYSVKRDGYIEISVADKLKALDMLAKHLGMYQDQVNVQGELTLVERLQQGRERAYKSEDET